MKFYTGRLRLQVQPLNLSYTNFLPKWYPFHIPRAKVHPFLYVKDKPKQQNVLKSPRISRVFSRSDSVA